MQAKVNIRPNTYIYIVVLLFLIPIKWLLAWLLAAGFHELCHWIAVRLCGGEIYNVTIGLGGAKMECSPLSKGQQLLSILCGPIGGLLPLLFARWLPRTALCCWALSVYNLLPLLHLDGGRAMEILLGAKADWVQRIFLILLSLGVAYLSFALDFGLLPIGLMLILWLKSRNTTCKPSLCKVQ